MKFAVRTGRRVLYIENLVKPLKYYDVAEKLGLELSAYHTILTESSAAHIFSFDQPDEHTGETMALPQSDEAVKAW